MEITTFAVKLSLVLQLVGILVFMSSASEWDNEYDGPIDKSCSNGQAFYRIRSEHHNKHEDRLWEFYCTSYDELSGPMIDVWHDAVNVFQGTLDFTCPSGYVITGVESVHDNHNEDRVWNYRCSSPAEDYCEHATVYITEYINEYDGDMDYSTSTNIIGFYSEYGHEARDQIWKVRTTDLNCDLCGCPEITDENWEFVNVTYDLASFTLDEADFVATAQEIENESKHVAVETMFSVSEGVEDSSSFSYAAGIALQAGFQFTASYPILKLDTSKSLELAPSVTHTAGGATSITKTVSASWNLKAESDSRIRSEAILTKSTISNVPYTMLLYNPTTECVCTSSGHWNGLQHNNLVLTVKDIDS